MGSVNLLSFFGQFDFEALSLKGNALHGDFADSTVGMLEKIVLQLDFDERESLRNHLEMAYGSMPRMNGKSLCINFYSFGVCMHLASYKIVSFFSYQVLTCLKFDADRFTLMMNTVGVAIKQESSLLAG